MPRYVALLRGINVGGNKRIAMTDFRALLSRLGCSEVRTLLNSDNAVFSNSSDQPKELADRIESRIEENLGLTVRCLVRTRDEIRAVIDGNPLRDLPTDGAKMLVLFVSEAPGPTLLEAYDPERLAPGEIRRGDLALYQWCPNGYWVRPTSAGSWRGIGKSQSRRETGTRS